MNVNLHIWMPRERNKTQYIEPSWHGSLLWQVLRLSDTKPDVIGSGAGLKAVKINRKLSDRMKISIKGDLQKLRTKEVQGSWGQGTNYAPKDASLTIGKATTEAIPEEDCDKIQKLVIPSMDFVKDVKIANANVNKMRGMEANML